jgi:PAS domain S-box-containing protein
VASGATLVALRADRAPAALAVALAAGADEVLLLPADRERLIARAIAAARTAKGRVDDAFLRHPLPSWVYAEDSLAILAVNDAAVRAWGWSREELLGMTVRDLRPPSEPGTREDAPPYTRPSEPGHTFVHRKKDGSRIDVEVVSQPLMFAGRRARIAVGRDVSEQLRAVEAHRRWLADYRSFVDRMPDGVFTYRTSDDTLLFVNRALLTLLGYDSPGELLGRPAISLISAVDLEAVRGRMRTILETPQVPGPLGFRFLTREGALRWFETRALPVTHDGEAAVTVIARDLSDRRRADEALRLSEERFYKIFQANPAAISITRLSDDTFVDVNDRFLASTGFLREEVIGSTGVALGLWRSPAARDRLDADVRSGKKVRDVEVTLVKKNGEPIEVMMSLEAFSVGGEACVFAISHDVTERKQLEQQLRHSQKMEAIGRLAGGIAHDFNNLLTALRGYAELLVRTLPSGTDEHNAADHIHRSALRAKSLTEQLLVFTRRQPHQPRVVALNDVVRSMGALLRRIIGEDVELALALSPERTHVRVDPSQIEQVLLNLAVNARDAMARGGRLTVETAPAEGNRVRLSVRDTGTGMTEETRLRVFEPFFTTKEVGKGTGLGLSIVYGVVVQHGGTIAVDSVLGRGTTFHIHLPSVTGPAEAEPVAAPLATPLVGRETILLVEDDEDVRDYVQFVLRQAGYEVLMAEDGVAALAVAQSHVGEIHLLLSDLIMPQMNGLRLVERLQPLRPRMRVLHMSGYPGHSIQRQGDLPAGVAFLQKPFSSDALIATVRAVLDG